MWERGTTTWISASILIELYTLCSVFKIQSCFHSLCLTKFSWRWNLNNFNRPKLFTSVFHLTLITCFLGLIWTWLFSNLYTSTSFNVPLVNIRFLYFSLHSGPGYVSASESITRRKFPRASSFPHLRYYKLTLQTNYGASYYEPGESPGALP